MTEGPLSVSHRSILDRALVRAADCWLAAVEALTVAVACDRFPQLSAQGAHAVGSRPGARHVRSASNLQRVRHTNRTAGVTSCLSGRPFNASILTPSWHSCSSSTGSTPVWCADWRLRTRDSTCARKFRCSTWVTKDQRAHFGCGGAERLRLCEAVTDTCSCLPTVAVSLRLCRRRASLLSGVAIMLGEEQISQVHGVTKCASRSFNRWELKTGTLNINRFASKR